MQMSTSKEVWKTIEGFPDYQVSNYGRVRSLGRYRKFAGGRLRWIEGKVLRQHINAQRGYYRSVTISTENAVRCRRLVHRLVAEAFIPNPEQKPFVNHIDCDTGNNSVSNLEWVTPKENVEWMVKLGRQKKTGKPLIAVDIHTGETRYFSTSIEAVRQGFNRSAIWRTINGEYKHHHGYIWKYA